MVDRAMMTLIALLDRATKKPREKTRKKKKTMATISKREKKKKKMQVFV